MLDEKWFAARGFYPVPPDEIDGRFLYAHRKGAFMNKFGLLLKHGFCLAKRQRNNRRSGKVYPYMVNYRAYCHRLIGRTFLRKLRKGEVYDHINGDISNYSLHNLRIVKKAINDRDGGFLRMLRNRGIDPTMYDQSFLLRFFKRMARKKKKLKTWKYQSLTRDDLLTMLVSPEYRVCPPLDPAAEPTKYYDPFIERD
jgi:hypothetical protein